MTLLLNLKVFLMEMREIEK